MKKGLDIEDIMEKARVAAQQFSGFSQEHTDRIVKAVYEAGFDYRIYLAKMAVSETRLGKWEDKVQKNILATRYVYYDIKDLKTVGIINEDKEKGITEVAKPIGPIYAITPITNPTSTTLFKILIALKTRNPIIIRPHGSARKCSCETARICYDAAIKAGAPENCIQWVQRSTPEQTVEMMGHKKIVLVLATGSVSLVRAAYRSGNPAIGVGPGNVPVYIGQSADIPFAVEQILISKTFDNGTICASEQALVVRNLKEKELIIELLKRNAYFLSEEEKMKIEKVSFNSNLGSMNTEVIGQTARAIAEMADIKVPENTSVLIARYKKNEIGLKYPLSLEILAPILAMYIVDSFEEAIQMCNTITRYGGMGHTISIYSNEEEKIMHFAEVTNAGRLLVNTPSSQGAMGGLYNGLQPSLTLATGSGGKNITTDNITARHLINIQRLARRKVCECMSCSYLNHIDESKTALMVDKECDKYKTK